MTHFRHITILAMATVMALAEQVDIAVLLALLLIASMIDEIAGILRDRL